MKQDPDNTGSGAAGGAQEQASCAPQPAGGSEQQQPAASPAEAAPQQGAADQPEATAQGTDAVGQAAAGGPQPDASAVPDTAAAPAPDAGEGQDVSAPAPAAEQADARISELEQQVNKLGDDLAQARADQYNLKREYSSFVRRQKDEGVRARAAGRRDVLMALLSVLDDIQAAREHDDLDGPFKAIAQKLESALEKGFELTRYGQAGDEFDPSLHDALLAQPSNEVEVATVAQVIQPGYRSGDQVLRPTKVMVNNPE